MTAGHPVSPVSPQRFSQLMFLAQFGLLAAIFAMAARTLRDEPRWLVLAPAWIIPLACWLLIVTAPGFGTA